MSGKRQERLQLEFERMNQLRGLNRGLVDFVTDNAKPPIHYRVTLRCEGVRLRDNRKVATDSHEVDVFLAPEYPDRAPQLQWRTAILHPNIKAPAVCAGLLEHWDSETTLDTVIAWLWDMIRYRIYDLESVLDRDATKWAKNPENAKAFPLGKDLRTLPVLTVPDSELVEIRMLDDFGRGES